MGITYRALDSNLGSLVALKVISARYSGDSKARERFHREARVAAQLRHRHVANVFHFGETATGQCFYAMELIEGGTLEARVRRDGPLTVPVALEVVTQVARALQAAEAHGLVHRDLKPSNLMVLGYDHSGTDALVIKVIDFGLAKPVTAIAGNAAPAHRGFSGTPDFASPEQFGNELSLDVRSDIFSLGATLWYLLSGQSPFSGRIVGETPDRPLPLQQLIAAKVPEPVITLLRSMLATDPAKRPQSAQELLGLLQRCRTAVEARSRRRAQLRLSLVTLGLLLVSALSLTTYLSDRQRARGRAPATGLPEKNAQDIVAHRQVAQKLMDRINANDYLGIEALFNAEMAKALPLAKTTSFFQGVMQQYGKLQKLDQGKRLAGTVVFPAHFERGELDLQIALDPEARIAGLFLKPDSAQDITLHRAVAQELMDRINAADYPGIEALFNAEMAKALPLAKTKLFFEDVRQQCGKLQALDQGERLVPAVVVFPAHFEHCVWDLQIALDLEGKIAGLFFKPHSGTTKSAPVEHQAELSSCFTGAVSSRRKTGWADTPICL
jgi:serine/threonine protein kinase